MARETIRREAAVRACMARFDGKELRYGVADCVRLVGHSMHKLGVGAPLLKGVRYRSELGAAKALRGLGFADLAEAVDALGFVRIGAAMAWPGDIIAGPSRESGPFRLALSVAHEYGAVRTLAFGPTPDGRVICGVGKPDLSHPDVIAWRVAHG